MGFSVSSIHTSHFGFNCVGQFASKVQNIVPNEPKNLRESELFKSEIKKWDHGNLNANYVCHMCTIYVM